LNNNLLYSVCDAASLLGISRAQLYRYIHASQIRTLKLGKLTRIPRAELVRFVERLAEEQHSDAAWVFGNEGGKNA